jgi:hypothetical protein
MCTEAKMVDEETKQLLRDILATQREQLAHSQRISEGQIAGAEAYASNSELYKKNAEEWKMRHMAFRRAAVIRAITMLGVVMLLGYVILFGLHPR